MFVPQYEALSEGVESSRVIPVGGESGQSVMLQPDGTEHFMTNSSKLPSSLLIHSLECSNM